MLNEDQLNGLYTQEDPGAKYLDGKQTPKPKGAVADPGDIYLRGRGNSRSYSPLSNVNTTNADADKFLGDRGIPNPENTGQDISLMIGEAQSFGNKLARRAANLVPNIVANILDMVGNVGSLLTEWGDERDYTNGMNELADSIKDPAGKSYARNNDTWALGDPSWWLNNIANLTEFAGAFALGGAGIAKGIASGIEGIGALTGAGIRGSKLLAAAGELGTSGLVSYAEAAQAGTQVYQEVYDNQIKTLLAKGLDPQEAESQAKHIASQSAATAAQLGTLLTMGINSGAYSSFFKSAENNARDIIAKRIAQASAGTGAETAGIIRGMNAADYMDKLLHHSTIRAKVGEMFKEGTEELLQQFAQQTGSDVGNKGQTKDFISQFGEIEHLIDRTANSQGLLSFVLGAGFGGIQNILLHNVIPSKRVNVMDGDTEVQRMNGDVPMTDKNGVPVMKKTWVTPRTAERDFTKRKFDSLKDSLAYDFENFDRINNDILKAVAKGDTIAAEQARNELFDSGRLHAIKQGMTEPWKKTFQGIADMTPEQAQEAGYINDESDLSYQDKANRAISDMDHLTDIYGKLNKKFGGNEANQPYIDMLFARHSDIYSTDRVLEDYEKHIVNSEKEAEELAKITDVEGFSKALNDHYVQRNSSLEVERQLIEDHATLLNGTTKDVERLLRKYRAIGYGDGDTDSAVKVLDEKLKAKQEEVISKVKMTEAALLNSNDFLTWQQKNPDKSFNDFMDEVGRGNRKNAQNMAMRNQLETAKSVQNIAKENLQEMTSDKSISKFSKEAAKWEDEMRVEAERAEEMRQSKLAELLKDKQAANRLEKIALNRIADDYRTQRDAVYKQITENNKKLAIAKDALDKVSITDPLRVLGLRRQIKDLNKSNTQLDAQGKKFDSLYKEYQVDTSIDETPVDEEDLTGEQNGKITESAVELPSTGTGEPEVITKPIELRIDDTVAPIPGELELVGDKDMTTDPIQIYTRLYKTLPSVIKGQLTRLVNGLMDGSKTPSLDFFNAQIAKGKITQAQAIQLVTAAADYVKAVKDLQAADIVDNYEEAQEESEPDVQQDEVDVSGIGEPDTPEIDNADEDTVVPESTGYHTGYKIINAAGTGATSTQGYDEGVRTGKKGEIVYFKVTDPKALNTELNEDILRSNWGLPGHPLRYEIDTEYDGQKLITDSLSWDSSGDVKRDAEKGTDYLDENGKVLAGEKNFGNVPIRVMDGVTGKFLFHIRKLDWLEAKFPGTKDYRNVVDTLYDADGNPIDNFSIQRDELVRIRQAIVDKFNTEGKATEGQIDIHGKGTGRLILNYVTTGSGTSLKGKVEKGFAYNKSNPDKSMLPDTSLTLVIADSGNVLNSGLKYPFTGELGFDKMQVPKGAVGAMVPAANGQYMYAPLIGMKVVEGDKPSPGLNSIVRAIELFLLNDGTDPQVGAEINNIESNTGFNIGTARGLKAFINQYYTYSQNFPDSALSPNAKGEKKERFLFNVDADTDILDKTKQIKAGFSMRGQPVQYANLVAGSLSPEFVGMLRNGLQTRSRAVNYSDANLGIKGINSIGTFIDATYVPDKGWKHEQYKNYNEYVKSFSRTPVYGRNQLSDGSYVYTANPQLPISTRALNTETEVIAMPNKSATEVNTGEVDIEAKKADIERRRQEELNKTVDPHKKLFADAKNLSDNATDAEMNELANRAIKLGVAKHENRTAFVRFKGEKHSLEYRTFVERPTEEINAKYDAELAALEVPPADTNLLDDWFNQSISRHTIPAIGTGSEKSQELTMATLEKIYNFTPERQRNGKTVKEVFSDLKGRGHTYLSDGFNPFSRCL